MSITLVVRLQFKTFFRKFATSKQLYYFNMKQQEAKRRKLREEIKWGFFGDVKEYQKTKGKLFSAEKDLINSVEAPLFPKFEAKSITGKKIVFPDLLKGKCSLLSIVSRDISMPLSKSFCDPFGKNLAKMRK
ncbi:uncharacterized protein LOC135146601 isoform X1 [Zophobas morio]|uniref:uncharacterized protein LOC135146601 isoform X1 n=1 Tax=Zophobas morio TaxID=2755281 RepID=UPI0030837613